MKEPNDLNEIDETAQCATLVGISEMGLGSLLHALHVPLAGQALSLNQIFLLSRSALRARGSAWSRRIALNASNIGALFKAFSPAGKKLTPMLAISVQGFLFSLPLILAGTNVVTLILGAILSSVWAFVQGPLVAAALLGHSFLDAVFFSAQKISELLHVSQVSIVWFLMSVVLFKAILAVGLVFVSRRLSASRFQAYIEKLQSYARPRAGHLRNALQSESVWRVAGRALKDVFNRWFVASLVLTLAFFIFSEAPIVTMLWFVCRSLGLAFLLFFLVRLLPLERVLLRGGESKVFSQAALRALRYLKSL